MATTTYRMDPIDETLYEFVKQGGDSFNRRQLEAWLQVWDGTPAIGTKPAYSMPSAAELLKNRRLA